MILAFKRKTLVNFTDKLKTASGECIIKMVTLSFPSFAVRCKRNSKYLYYKPLMDEEEAA